MKIRLIFDVQTLFLLISFDVVEPMKQLIVNFLVVYLE